MDIDMDCFPFYASAELKLEIDLDEPNQKASSFHVTPYMTQIHPPSRSSKYTTHQVRAEKQC